VLAASRVDLGRAAAYACALSLAGAPAPAAARAATQPAMTAAAGARAPLYFSIPALPLAQALERYAVVADETVLFSDELVAQRRSHAIDGHFTPQEALDLLLIGTRLRAERMGEGGDSDSFVLREDHEADVSAPRLDRSYDGLVQQRVWQALCARRLTAPGNYRAILLLEVDATGRLKAPQLLGSTGSPGRDRAIVATLQGLRLEALPPPSLQQPLALVILPTRKPAPVPCASQEGGDE
jgi:Secretin and TonB N terminus short domain